MSLLLIDSASLWYRAYYGMPDTLVAPDGTPVNAIRGFLDMTMVGVDDYEADDLIATYSVNEPGPTHIVTGDRDLFQLVDDDRSIRVIYLAKGFSQQEVVDRKWVGDKYGIPGDRYALFAMIRGDASDGLPGVRGIGEKGAAVIANAFTSIDEALIAARNDDERLTPLLRKRLIEGSDYIAIAPKLVHCALDVPLPAMNLDLPKAPQDLSEIYAFKERYGLGASVDRLIAALGW